MARFSRVLRFGVALFGAGALFLGGSAGAIADTQNSHVPFDAMLFNPCNGDTVPLTGTVHILNATPTGQNSHFDFLLNTEDVHGIGVPSGDMYVFSGLFMNVNAGNPNSVTVTQSVDSARLISQGADQNWLVLMTNHIAFDSQGNIVSFHSDVIAECTG